MPVWARNFLAGLVRVRLNHSELPLSSSLKGLIRQVIFSADRPGSGASESCLLRKAR